MNKSRKVGPLRVRAHLRNGVRTGKWFVDIPASLTGTGRRKRKLFDNQKSALEVARRLRRELERRTLGLDTPPRSGISLEEAVARWTDDQQARVRTLKIRSVSLNTSRYRLTTLVAFLGNDDLASITEKRLEEFQEWRLQQGRKPSTINGEVATLSKVLRWAVKKGYLKDCIKVESIPCEPPDVAIPTKEEVVRLIRALPEQTRPIVWFIAETGCRSGEAFNLTWDCVDEVNGVVEFKSKDGWTPKTRSSHRRIYISGELLETIRGLPKAGRYVFPGLSPDKARTRIDKVLERAAKKANLTRNRRPMRITPHTLRKAHATWLAMEGVPQQVLQARLGHARGSRITDQYYVYATDEANRAAITELPMTRTEPKRN